MRRAVLIEPPEVTGDGTLRVHDTGIGLTEAQVHELLATIGRSSKRDELGFARHEFLGQFGIGLLSCFLVADEIQVVTRRPTARRRCAGSATPTAGTRSACPRQQRAEQGTTVTLAPRRDAEQWLTGPDRHRAGPALRVAAAGHRPGRRRPSTTDRAAALAAPGPRPGRCATYAHEHDRLRPVRHDRAARAARPG